MLWTAMLCFMLYTAVDCDVESGIEGIDKADMGFFVINLTCNDADTSCMSCFSAHKYGRPYLYEFELSKYHNPRFHIAVTSGEQNWEVYFIQDDLSDSFRHCTVINATTEVELHQRLIVNACIDNDFLAVSVPAECGQPVLVYTVKTRRGNEKPRGQQVLYCIPKRQLGSNVEAM
ncbi:uncharacterized protein LOC119733459 [Patiria miniata]|uniref:Uncharacterized protein n=1 Tax=Patiria miniata TaxID=46514 RepID=A0A914AGV5_PATMI|nr:uncharacterized protein LOC119733459 [Patiria miniata]